MPIIDENNNLNDNKNNNGDNSDNDDNQTFNELYEQIMELRNHMIELHQQNPDLFDELDIELLRYDDRLIENEISSRKSLHESKQSFVEAFKLRKQFKVPRLKAIDFPIELHRSSVIFPYGCDKFGHGLLYIRLRFYRPIKQLGHLIRQYLLYITEKYYRETKQNGLSLIIDYRHSGYSNLDTDLLNFIIRLMLHHFPYVVKYMYIHEMTYAFRLLWNALKHLVPSDKTNRIIMTDKHTITNYIDIDQLPPFMNGNCKKSYYQIPDNHHECVTFQDLGFTDHEYKHFIKTYKHMIDECEKELKYFESQVDQ